MEEDSKKVIKDILSDSVVPSTITSYENINGQIYVTNYGLREHQWPDLCVQLWRFLERVLQAGGAGRELGGDKGVSKRLPLIE
eukprot:822905-Heterocapsa_arctica.AAC.1